MKRVGRVEIPQEAFLAVLKVGNTEEADKSDKPIGFRRSVRFNLRRLTNDTDRSPSVLPLLTFFPSGLSYPIGKFDFKAAVMPSNTFWCRCWYFVGWSCWRPAWPRVMSKRRPHCSALSHSLRPISSRWSICESLDHSTREPLSDKKSASSGSRPKTEDGGRSNLERSEAFVDVQSGRAKKDDGETRILKGSGLDGQNRGDRGSRLTGLAGSSHRPMDLRRRRALRISRSTSSHSLSKGSRC